MPKSDKESIICLDCKGPAEVRTVDTKMPYCKKCYKKNHSTRVVQPICKKGHMRDDKLVQSAGDWCPFCISCDSVEGCEDLEGLNEEVTE